MEVSGAAARRMEEPDLYITMLDMKITSSVVEDQINTDLPRTFPNNMYFDKTSSTCYQRPLYNILRAFANNNPNIGYCQGLNYIAGLLFLVTKDEDTTFWLLKALCEKILPDYYTQSMPGLLTDMKVLARLARQEVPAVGQQTFQILQHNNEQTKYFLNFYLNYFQQVTSRGSRCRGRCSAPSGLCVCTARCCRWRLSSGSGTRSSTRAPRYSSGSPSGSSSSALGHGQGVSCSAVGSSNSGE